MTREQQTVRAEGWLQYAYDYATRYAGSRDDEYLSAAHTALWKLILKMGDVPFGRTLVEQAVRWGINDLWSAKWRCRPRLLGDDVLRLPGRDVPTVDFPVSELLRLHYLEGHTQQEIADMQGVTRQAICERLAVERRKVALGG